MRKILSLLAAIALSTTTSASSIACGGGETSNPFIQKTNLKDLSNSANIIVKSDVDNRVMDFKTKLINKLKIETFQTLSLDDVDIVKTDKNNLQNRDIKTGIINIKIIAQLNSSNFTGQKNIAVTIKFIPNINLELPIKSLVLSGTDLYAGCENSSIYKININTKYSEEIINLGSPTTESVYSLVLSGTDLYAGCQNGKIYKININTKTKEEIIDFNSAVDGLVSFNDTFLYVGCNNRKIYKFDINLKKQVQEIKMISKVYSLVLSGTDLYAGCENSSIYKININTKYPEEIINLGSPTTESVYSLVLSGTDLYAGCQNGKIYKININTKTKEEIIDFSWISSINDLVLSGTDLYAGCENNSIYKVKF